jgi:hypothetical protein
MDNFMYTLILPSVTQLMARKMATNFGLLTPSYCIIRPNLLKV